MARRNRPWRRETSFPTQESPVSKKQEAPSSPQLMLSREQRRWLSYHDPKRAPRTKTARAQSAIFRVVVAPTPETTREGELLLLAALEELKRGHNSLALEYLTGRMEIEKIAATAWFLKRVYWQPLYTEVGALVQDLAGDDVAFPIAPPDHDEAVAQEEALYKAEFERRVAEAETFQTAEQEKGNKDVRIPLPEYQFQPRWHQGNAYLWKLQEELGLPVAVPETPLTPYLQISRDEEKRYLKSLAQAHLTDQPFVLYELSEDPEALPAQMALAGAFPDHRVIALAEVAVAAGDGLQPLLAAMSHPHCRGAFLPADAPAYAAWAAGVTDLIQSYTGETPAWDAAQSKLNYLILRDRVPEGGLPQEIARAVQVLRLEETL